MAAQPGKVSDRQTFRNEGKFGPHFKGQLWSDICEFESSRPSQPVRSLLFDFRLCANCRHSRGLCWCARVSGWQIPDFRLWTGGFGGASLCSPFSNFRFGMPETGSTLRETGWKAATRCGAKRRRAAPAGGCTVRPVLHAWQPLAKPVEYAMEGLLSWGRKTLDHRMAIFRQVNKERTAAHGREIASFPLVGRNRQPEADWHGKIKETRSDCSPH